MLLEKVSLSWTDFQSNLVKTYSNLRHEDDLCDVTLATDDHQQVSAHKLVLSSCSEYFKNLFRMNKHSNFLVCLHGVLSKDLEHILDYMYNGEVNIHKDQLDTFMDVAQRLKVEGLTSDSGVRQVINDYKQFKCEEESLNSTGKIESHNLAGGMVEYSQEDVVKSEVNSISNTMYKVDKEELKAKLHNEMYKDGRGFWNCKHCTKFTKDKGHMREHVEVHMEGLNFPCNKCDKTFKRSCSLRQHNINSHDDKLRG